MEKNAQRGREGARITTYTIKPLEWEERGRANQYASKDGLSNYDVSRTFGTAAWWVDLGAMRISKHPTCEAAKQAAQDHWESRLKGALEEVT